MLQGKNAIITLASDKSSYVIGETIKVDVGGTDLRLSISK